MKNLLGKFITLITSVFLIVATFVFAYEEPPSPKRTTERELKTEIQIDPRDPVILEMISKIEHCESRGKNVRVLDTNNKYSTGVLQFQEDTFIFYVKRFNMLPYAEEGEMLNLMYTPEFQRELAYLILEEDLSNLRNWYNCSKHIGYL